MSTLQETLELVRKTNVAIPTSEVWRELMKRVRNERGLTQGALAVKAKTTQANISQIENGVIQQSTDVAAICGVLSIPLPFFFVSDEVDARWIDAGRVLRRRDPDTFEKYLDLVEAMAGDSDDH